VIAQVEVFKTKPGGSAPAHPVIAPPVFVGVWGEMTPFLVNTSVEEEKEMTGTVSFTVIVKVAELGPTAFVPTAV
jgi:hypothetical protein